MKYLCPTCEREVEVGHQCRHCAKPVRSKKKERRSWEEDGHVDGLDLPDDHYDNDDFVAREFGRAPHRKTGLAWYWYAVAVLLIVLMVMGMFF